MADFSSRPAKPPRLILDGLYAFPPNRDTLGGTAYFLSQQDTSSGSGNILVDAPPWHEVTQDFLAEQGVRWLVITHRGAIGQTAKIQKTLNCEVVVQEQEAYLLPQTPTTTFQSELELSPQARLLWTPGHTPGSSCLYHHGQGGILFSGRHLLPTAQEKVMPLRFAKTFHWPRQLTQVRRLQEEFSVDTLQYLCPGANTGFLRGQRVVADAYRHLQAINLEELAQMQPLL